MTQREGEEAEYPEETPRETELLEETNNLRCTGQKKAIIKEIQ